MSWICPNCETENPDGLTVCEVCDSPRELSPVEMLKKKLKEKYSDVAYKTFIQYHYGLLASADEGHTIDQYQVAEWFYSRGNAGSSDNYSMIAAFWYRKAAMREHIDAQVKLASCYEEGRGVYQDKDEAMKWYKKAAVEGDLSATVKYLKLKYDKKTYEGVIRYRITLLSDADRGDRISQYLLGEWFRSHNSQSSYREEAVLWYTKAAQSGHVEAMFKLGECYDTGFGVYGNLSEAFGWFTKAAQRGHLKAMFKLGELYETGFGVYRSNINEAIKWYKKAAKERNNSATLKLAQLYLYGKIVNKDVEEALRWYELAGNDITTSDLSELGYSYEVGNGVRQDISKAVYYYGKAAAKGNCFSLYHLGMCYEHGRGVAKDLGKARSLYAQAAYQGHESAKEALSRINNQGHEPANDPLPRTKSPKVDYSLIWYVLMGLIETAFFVYYTNEPQFSWVHRRFISFATNELWIETGAIILIAGACLMSLFKGSIIATLIYGCFAFGFYLNQPDDSWVHQEIFSLIVTKSTNIVFEVGTTLMALATWFVGLFEDS